MKPLSLMLVLSRWMSLSKWDELGMFEREVALYRRLAKRGVKVSFLTWGGVSERRFASRLPGITVHCNWLGLPIKRYEKLAPLVHFPPFLRADVIKTNQSSSAIIAAPAARLWRKPLIARMGFMASDFSKREKGEASADYCRDYAQETTLFKQASAIVVTTDAMAANVEARLAAVPDRRPLVIPNFVDTDLFSPHPEIAQDEDVLFVGRLSEQKNIPVLLEVLERTGAKATIVGDGPLAPLVVSAMSRSKGKITWIASVPNAELPFLIARARIFILPSLWEGHPKTLLEAMSCGAAVIGADTPGIGSVIRNGKTGLLVPPETESLAGALTSLLASPARRQEMGLAARAQICATCSLDFVAEQEYQLLRKLAAGAS